MGTYTMVDGTSELAWLTSDIWSGALGTGVWRKGFESTAVILHAMWRDPNSDAVETHAEREARQGSALDSTIPLEVHEILAAGTTLASIGLPSHPELGLERVRWANYACEHGGSGDFSRRAFPTMALTSTEHVYPHMDASVFGPDEGTLDELQATALVAVLSDVFGDQRVFKHCFPQAWRSQPDPLGASPVMATTLREILTTIDAPADDGHGFGQNVWPEDHRWITYSDYDSWWTIVSGPSALIARILSEPNLEAYIVDPAAIAQDEARVVAERRARRE